jgi:indole-3-glycerol phosphate synthase
LARILEAKREEAAALAGRTAELRALAREAEPPRDFMAALRRRPGRAVIAEIKRRSPSRGWLRPGADAAAMARTYRAAGAAAVSVLTDGPFFGGGPADLARARTAGLPVLCKDFLVHEAQVWQARVAGADAVLLIAAALEPARLACLAGLAAELGMAALLEVHDQAELSAAARLRPELVGINHRDLSTLAVDPARGERLAALAPAGACLVAESGIRRPEDIARLRAAGLHAYLVGTCLMQAPEPGAALRALVEAG